MFDCSDKEVNSPRAFDGEETKSEKGKIAKAQEAIREKNIVVLHNTALPKEVEELREKLAASEKARAEA